MKLPKDEQKACMLHEIGHTKINIFSIYVYALLSAFLAILSILPFAGFVLWFIFPFLYLSFYIFTIYMLILLPFAIVLIRLSKCAEKRRKIEYECDAYAASIIGKDPIINLIKNLRDITLPCDNSQKLWTKLKFIYIDMSDALIGRSYPFYNERIKKLEDDFK